jgi:hypothetical protein
MVEPAWKSDGSLPPRAAHAFAPAHKSAFGVAVGATFGAVVALVTIFHVLAQPADGPPLALLDQYFYGYTVSWPGAAIGFFWGFVSGFVGGWFVAFVRNFSLAVWLLYVRVKSGLSNPFLDHI